MTEFDARREAATSRTDDTYVGVLAHEDGYVCVLNVEGEAVAERTDSGLFVALVVAGFPVCREQAPAGHDGKAYVDAALMGEMVMCFWAGPPAPNEAAMPDEAARVLVEALVEWGVL